MGVGGMAEYGYFISEKQLIDQYLEDGYDILEVNDDLNGPTFSLNILRVVNNRSFISETPIQESILQPCCPYNF